MSVYSRRFGISMIMMVPKSDAAEAKMANTQPMPKRVEECVSHAQDDTKEGSRTGCPVEVFVGLRELLTAHEGVTPVLS